MNIKQAKEEIRNTLRSYLKKDETGSYVIPVERQRPILLIGPPGIGKTAIMEQVARECGVGLVSYTITHHTRQSAIGLPFISHKVYGGKEMAVTEYTMSEIIASVYEQIEQTGVKEGILFLDEINCVSETLAPTMLQFLQYKTFGAHRVPDGYIIVTAGNTVEYNRSVRPFDIVTLDRVKKIEVEADFEAWKEYAYNAHVHGAILAYLEIRKERFYNVHTEEETPRFVTARGWEDLSRMIRVYEEEGIPVTAELAGQYLQESDTAEDFAAYYALYNKYKALYRIPEILGGVIPEGSEVLSRAAFDEKLSILGLLTDALFGEFGEYVTDKAIQERILKALQNVLSRSPAAGPEGSDGSAAVSLLENEIRDLKDQAVSGHTAGILSPQDEHVIKKAALLLSELKADLVSSGIRETDCSACLRKWFSDREDIRQKHISDTDAHLTNVFGYLGSIFGDGQELVIFLTEINKNMDCLRFVGDCGNEAYDRYLQLLLLQDRRAALQREAKLLLE